VLIGWPTSSSAHHSDVSPSAVQVGWVCSIVGTMLHIVLLAITIASSTDHSSYG